MKNQYKIIVVILVLFISIGFAYLTANLDITGTIAFRENTWDVHLDNIVVESESLDAHLPTINNEKKAINFTITITRPGDYYEFYVDVINSGTLDASLDSMAKSPLTGDYATYLNYNVTYFSNREITQGDLLRAGCKERIKVRVEYKYDLNTYKQLGNINLYFRLNYIKTDTHNPSYNNKVWNFDSKGEEDIFKVPMTGTYKLEVWGAQGGSTSFNNVDYLGGYGGYSVGEVSLLKDSNLYINVGEEGHKTLNWQITNTVKGGYNGGGTASFCISYEEFFGTGGGATHIAKTSGVLSTLSTNIPNIIIVAGGGGGAGLYVPEPAQRNAGSGGGYIGSSGTNNHNGTAIATGGTQTTGGSSGGEGYPGTFGQGGSFSTNSKGSSGGGGFYGGGSSGAYGGASAGGSGYIGNTDLTNKIMYCYNCQSSENEADETHIKTRSTTNISETPTSNYAKIGSGYAKITFIE